jgi:hypothetical protein
MTVPGIAGFGQVTALSSAPATPLLFGDELDVV